VRHLSQVYDVPRLCPPPALQAATRALPIARHSTAATPSTPAASAVATAAAAAAAAVAATAAIAISARAAASALAGADDHFQSSVHDCHLTDGDFVECSASHRRRPANHGCLWPELNHNGNAGWCDCVGRSSLGGDGSLAAVYARAAWSCTSRSTQRSPRQGPSLNPKTAIRDAPWRAASEEQRAGGIRARCHSVRSLIADVRCCLFFGCADARVLLAVAMGRD
jgi:hypothetical protein